MLSLPSRSLMMLNHHLIVVKTISSSSVKNLKEAIIKLLQQKLFVPEEIIKDIAIIPTGYHQRNPPDRDDWFTSFWVEAFRKTKESGLSALIGISATGVQKVSAHCHDSKSWGAFDSWIAILTAYLQKTFRGVCLTQDNADAKHPAFHPR